MSTGNQLIQAVFDKGFFQGIHARDILSDDAMKSGLPMVLRPHHHLSSTTTSKRTIQVLPPITGKRPALDIPETRPTKSPKQEGMDDIYSPRPIKPPTHRLLRPPETPLSATTHLTHSGILPLALTPVSTTLEKGNLAPLRKPTKNYAFYHTLRNARLNLSRKLHADQKMNPYTKRWKLDGLGTLNKMGDIVGGLVEPRAPDVDMADERFRHATFGGRGYKGTGLRWVESSEDVVESDAWVEEWERVPVEVRKRVVRARRVGSSSGNGGVVGGGKGVVIPGLGLGVGDGKGGLDGVLEGGRQDKEQRGHRSNVQATMSAVTNVGVIVEDAWKRVGGPRFG